MSGRFLPNTLASINIAATGVLLGLLQWSAFFLLQSYLASTAVVYLLATTVWLCGSVAGLLIPGSGREPLWLGGAAAAYYAMRALASAHPYDFRYLPLLLLCVAAMGAYAGRFFRYRGKAPGGAKWLFFIENTGFVTGMALTVIALFWFGDSFLGVAPAIAAVFCLATSRVRRFT